MAYTKNSTLNKDVYDIDENDVVDKAEELDDGAYSFTATELNTQLDDKLDATNFYYSNTGSGSAIYVKFATIVNTGTYNKCELIFKCSNIGNARDTGEIQAVIHFGGAYNTLLASTHYLMKSDVNFWADDSFMYVATDNESDTYTIDLWAKVEAYAGFYVTTLHQVEEQITSDLTVTYLPTSPTTSGTEPSSAVYFTNRKQYYAINFQNFTETTDYTTTINVLTYVSDFTSTYDTVQLYVNGLKWYKTKHWTESSGTITFTGSNYLMSGDEVELVVQYNTA